MADKILTLAQTDALLSKLAERMHSLDGTEIAGPDADQAVNFEFVGWDGSNAAGLHTPIIKVTDAEGDELTRFILVAQ